MKLSPRALGLMGIAFAISFMTIMFTAAFFLTGWIYQIAGRTPSPLLVQIINSLGGLVLGGVTIGALSRAFRSRINTRENRVFGPIIEALARIAQGDFSVRVDPLEGARANQGFIGELVNSVNRTAMELHHLEAMRQEFISNVSHELQSPLTSIRGFAQALRSSELNEEDRIHYLSIIENESLRLSRITDNLLKLATLESAHARFEPHPYRLDKQIRSLILASEVQWTDKHLEMDVALEEVEVSADEDLMSQVWTNLLHNAIKFTPAGGKIGVALQRDAGRAVVRVSDTGIGISEADQAHIFERFYKADRSRTRSDTGGSGLGLSIVQKIVEMHRGSVAVSSQPGFGATFSVELPLA